MNVQFFTEDLTVQNAAWLEAEGKRVLAGPVQITTALTIPMLAGSAIVSLTTTSTTPTMTTTSCAIMANDEMLRALRAMELQNARLSQEISNEFAKAGKPLLDVHRGAAR